MGPDTPSYIYMNIGVTNFVNNLKMGPATASLYTYIESHKVLFQETIFSLLVAAMYVGMLGNLMVKQPLKTWIGRVHQRKALWKLRSVLHSQPMLVGEWKPFYRRVCKDVFTKELMFKIFIKD